MSRCGAPAAAPLAERSLRAAGITAEPILAEGDGQVRRRPGRIDVDSSSSSRWPSCASGRRAAVGWGRQEFPEILSEIS